MVASDWLIWLYGWVAYTGGTLAPPGGGFAYKY